MTHLTKQDWEKAKEEAINLLKQAEMLKVNGDMLLERSKWALKEFKAKE